MKFANLGISTTLAVGFGLVLAFLTTMMVLGLTTAHDSGYKLAIAIFGIGSLLVGSFGAWWAARGIIGPLKRTILVTKRMASGDLSEPYQANEQGDLGDLQ